MSDSDSGEENANAKPISDSAVQDTIPNLSGVDAERIRAQLGANTDSVRSFTRIYLFSSTKWPATAPTAAGFVVNTDAVFKTDDPVEKVFSANACTYRKFMQHALSSQWIKAQASSIESLARTATLPSQIILRVVSELMEGSDRLFRVNASVDFAKLEAIIGLLSNILDSVQAMRDVRDVSRAIYQRLCVINQRISDGVADSIDKTLAKDAVQTLVVRLLMTAVSDSTEQRLSPVYNTSTTLDSWMNSS
ncbi:hypothetical protein H4R26_003989 [Coemansia thaxteri]|uniref:Uncharacterized protein n=1 Tax=Coemansia thaxteri TaxID=2663907 RepID=A0A9W8EH52_9FUNG|nr:hypothetical protein H4R26_003989 [Coemansia thaxteri]